MNDDHVCLVDYVTMHTNLQDKRYFLKFTLTKTNISTIYNTINLVEGSKRTNIMLPNGTRLHIN